MYFQIKGVIISETDTLLCFVQKLNIARLILSFNTVRLPVFIVVIKA